MTSSPTVTDIVQPTGVAATKGITQTASGNWTQSTTDTITVNATSTNTVKSVEIYDNGKDLAAATWDSVNSDWTYTAAGLADGTHTFSAIVTDNKSNSSTLASSPTVTDKVDSTAPVISASQTASGAWTTSTSDTITLTVSDATLRREFGDCLRRRRRSGRREAGRN